MSRPTDRVRQRFDPEQSHQLEAIRAIVDVLAGQARVPDSGWAGPQRLSVTPTRLLDNLRTVQARHGLPQTEGLADDLQLSVEMETGTGKTYAYLRLLRELYQRYGLSRFVVVVPSVAIREGLATQIVATAEHLHGLYPTSPVSAVVYRGGRWSDLRSFAEGPGVQVLILNIDAFNKGRGNLIHRPADALGGRCPIELIAGAGPVVVLDEPQNMEGPRAREALASLEASFTLRWSATHRHAHQLVYRLDPVRAWDLGLVKRIEVAGIVADAASGAPPVELRRVQASSRGVSAKLVLEAAGESGPERRVVTVRGDAEALHTLSGGREIYSGWVIDRVDADPPRVVFTNGQVVTADRPLGRELRAATMRAQVEEMVRAHLEHEQRVQRLCRDGERVKVLSLVFVDRVADWIDDGPVQRWFKEAWTRLNASPPWSDLGLPPAEAAAAAYFAERRGTAIDTKGRSRDDDAAYGLIMRDKARLLSRSEPVRVVVSHSALREGWDNPNVFQICTLHPSRTDLRKRQEIGRGLRLPVQEDGRRCRDPDIARLVVVANDSYQTFARQLQREVREDFGVELGDRVVDRTRRRQLSLRPGWSDEPALHAAWARIGRPAEWTAAVAPGELEARVVEAVTLLPREGAQDGSTVTITRGRVDPGGEGGAATVSARRVAREDDSPEAAIPDPIAALQRDTGLTAQTLSRVLTTSQRLDDLASRPIAFLDDAGHAIRRVVRQLQATAVRYHASSGGAPVPLSRFEDRAPRSRGDLVPLRRGIYDAVASSSTAEADWLREVDADPATALVFRWPRWLNTPSPLGRVDAGWVVVRTDGAMDLGPAPGSPPLPRERALCLTALATHLGATVRPAG